MQTDDPHPQSNTAGNDQNAQPTDASDYQFPVHYNGPGLSASVEAIHEVFDALVAAVRDGQSYVSPTDLSTDRDRATVGKALRALSDDEGCPIALARWTGEHTTPATYRATWRADPAAPDTEPVETVYVSGSWTRGRSSGVYHSDPQCPHLAKADSVDARDRDEVGDDVSPCTVCAKSRERRVATDGGVPDHITEMPVLGGGTMYRCQTCGREGETPDSVAHHEQCPETDDGPDHDTPVEQQLTDQQRDLVDGGDA